MDARVSAAEGLPAEAVLLHMLQFVWIAVIYTNSHILLADDVCAFGSPDGQYVSFNRAVISSPLFASVLATLWAPDNDHKSAGFLFMLLMVNT